MDTLSREVFEHASALEELHFFENYTKVFSRTSCANYLRRINIFFDEFIVKHFDFEEKEIFPLILEKGNDEEKKMIQELQNEHRIILEYVADFKDQATPFGSQLNNENIRKILLLSQPVTRKILEHARKEDAQLLPAMKKHLISFKS